MAQASRIKDFSLKTFQNLRYTKYFSDDSGIKIKGGRRHAEGVLATPAQVQGAEACWMRRKSFQFSLIS